jgi:hypothetical protein
MAGSGSREESFEELIARNRYGTRSLEAQYLQ